MRVLVVHGRYRSAAPSGENNVVDRETASLRGVGHDVEVFQRHSDEIAAWTLRRKAALPLTSIRNSEVRRALTDCLEAFRPDVVHVHNTFPLLSASVLLACRDAAVPVVATVHNYKLLCASGDFFREGAPCHDCITGRTAPAIRHGCYRGSRFATLPIAVAAQVNRPLWRDLVAAYIFISAAQRDLHSSLRLPPDRVFVKHNFVPEPNGSGGERRSVSARRRHQVTYLGRLDEAKGVPFLMRAWDVFRNQNPASTLRLAIVGGGPLEEEVRRWALSHDSVDVRGHVKPPEAAGIVAQATAAVVPSQWEETFGLVAVEAMAAGVPPVAPDRGSFPELIDDGRTGSLYRAGDEASLARVLAEVDARPEEFASRGERAHAEYEQRFRRGPNIAELESIYRFAVDHPCT